MYRFKLYIMDMSHAFNTSGVDRYIGSLLQGLRKTNQICVCWIHLSHHTAMQLPQKEQYDGYIKYTIPLPQSYDAILHEDFWLQKYNRHVFYMIKELFDHSLSSIIHLHTLNLINLGLLIQEYMGEHICKIVIHLHCIPWKGLYNINQRRFNDLYALEQTRTADQLLAVRDRYLTHMSELLAYNSSDALVCVTKCAKRFIHRITDTPKGDISFIMNGIADPCPQKIWLRNQEKNYLEQFYCLYVGVVSESKGFRYILKALREVQKQGYKVSLRLVGACSYKQRSEILQEFSDLEVEVLGRVSFEELQELYSRSDIGVIASLQEQASYVAIEMAMFGLPIVTTAVDGLDEMFTDEENALKVNTMFSPVLGLSVDINHYSQQIIRLIKSADLRKHLSMGARSLYERSFRLESMINKTIRTYCRLLHISQERL